MTKNKTKNKQAVCYAETAMEIYAKAVPVPCAGQALVYRNENDKKRDKKYSADFKP